MLLPPQSNDEGVKEQKRAILASLKWGEGWSRCSIYFVQDCSTVLQLNTGIDPTFHWTSKQWALLARPSPNTAGTSVIDHLLPLYLHTKLEIYGHISVYQKERRWWAFESTSK